MKFRSLLMGHHDDHAKARLTEALDRVEHEVRLRAVKNITNKEQQVLWEMFEGSAVTLSHLVPSGTEPLKEVIHHGKNSLPAFNFFQKRFCLTEKDQQKLAGYNHGDLEWLIGPGYYVAYSTEQEGEAESGGVKAESSPGSFVVDYTQLPQEKPESWPEIVPAGAKMGRFVYQGMKDYLRKVSEHICVGRAYKGGKAMDAWFVLCREDPAD